MRYWLLFILIVLCGCEPQTVKTPAPVQPAFIAAIEALRPSVAPVVCLSVAADGGVKLDFIAGSAFFVTKDAEFVTARHVIAQMQPAPLRPPCNVSAIYFPKNGKWPQDGRFIDMKWFAFDIDKCVLSNPALDLARCKPRDDVIHNPDVTVPPVPVTIDAALPPEGSEVGFIGFPLQIPLPRSAKANIAGYGSRDNAETSDMVIDRSTWPGASGSPVFLMNGHVVGVVLARGTNDAAGLAFARTGNLLDRFLREPQIRAAF